MSALASLDPLRILLVADDDESGRAITALLGTGFAAGVRLCARPEQTLALARSHRAAAVVLGLSSLDANERLALALAADAASPTGRPYLIALCSAVACAGAASLSRGGVIDDYVQHFPTPADPARLATSMRLAERIAKPAATASVAPPTTPRPKPVVLVVEDDEVMHALVRAMLESEHLELLFETDGAVALERIRAIRPDLVVMDVMLPNGDGVTLTQQIKAAPALAAIPVVMLSGEARLDTLVRSMEAGAADFIVKPFTREALVAKLAKYLPAAS